jgi:hypothetical protein
MVRHLRSGADEEVSMLHRMPAVTCSLVAVTLIAAGSALAEPTVVTASAEPLDRGPVIGVAAGLGWMNGPDVPAIAGTAIAIDAGVRMSPRTALVADVELTRENAGRTDSVHYAGTQTLGVQVWPAESFWLRPSLGFGLAQYTGGTDDPYARDGLGPAAVLAAGAEVVSRRSWAIDVQLRGSALYHYGDTAALNTGLLLGVAWR